MNEDNSYPRDSQTADNQLPGIVGGKEKTRPWKPTQSKTIENAECYTKQQGDVIHCILE